MQEYVQAYAFAYLTYRQNPMGLTISDRGREFEGSQPDNHGYKDLEGRGTNCEDVMDRTGYVVMWLAQIRRHHCGRHLPLSNIVARTEYDHEPYTQPLHQPLSRKLA